MHGDILVESEPGKGSTFHFLTLMQKVKEEVKEDPPNEILQDKKILIVDDNRHNIEILSHTLGKAGMKATGLTQPDDVVSTLLEALAKNDPFQLCILDIRMPEISGYEVAKQVRGLSSPVAKIPLLAFSSSTSGRINRYRDFGFDAFLPKPARKREVLAIIEELFQKGSGEKEKTDDIIIPAPESMLEVAVQPCLLLAEDNPINRKLAGFILNRAGYRYEIAENGKEAVEKFTRAPDHFDLILMDVRMPVMDGIAAVKIIRERGFTRIPIVAMTAQSMKGDREKCLKAGMDDYISKPIRKASFLKVLKKYLK
jgi:CheY-like chemotaxis protein